MAPCLLCCFVLQLFLLSNAEYYLTVNPVNPVVSIGSSIQLNCSLNCPLGIVAWKGLDIYQNDQYIVPGYSVQTLKNISISMGGSKYCEAICPGYRKIHQKSVQLHVYALPTILLLSNSMKNDIHYLNCSMERVHPPPEISCYRGSEMLGEPTDINEVSDEEDLYNVSWSWKIPTEDWLSEISYRCEAKVLVNGQVFTREGTLNITSKAETTTTVHDFPTSQITSTQSEKSRTPYLTTTTENPQDSLTSRSQQLAIPGEYKKNATINVVTPQHTQPTLTQSPIRSMHLAEYYLTVNPVNPVVSIGSSIQLNCSLNCPLGIVAWKGLDIYQNDQYIVPGYSVQTLKNISISMGGSKYCEAICPGYRKIHQTSVQLHVYALPTILLLSNSMKNDIHYLNCSMERVHPPPEISCYRGSEMLGEPTDINEVSDEEDLHNVSWSWKIPTEDWLSEISYRCEAKVLVNGQVFTREGTLNITSKVETTTSVPASSIHVTTSISTSENPQTTQESPTIRSQQMTISGEHAKNATINTVMTQSARPTMTNVPSKPINLGWLMWTIVPATGLLGSFLLSLHIYRQLSKKGFFQLNHVEFPTAKKEATSQGSLQAVLCYDASSKKEFSMC